MRTNTGLLLSCLTTLSCLPIVFAQEVLFDISPSTGAPLNNNTAGIPTTTTIQVEPGTVVSYQVGVFVQPTPTFPNVNGLASFNIDILTNLGVAQRPLDQFNASLIQSFPAGRSLGTPLGDDIFEIAATQDLSGFTNAGVGLGARQVIGTGQLITPNTEGDFQITVAGAASVLNTGVNPFNPVLQPATVSMSGALLIQTRIATDDDDDDTDDDDQGLNDFGADLVNACFSGAAGLLPLSIAGLMGMHSLFRRAYR